MPARAPPQMLPDHLPCGEAGLTYRAKRQRTRSRARHIADRVLSRHLARGAALDFYIRTVIAHPLCEER
jgi:hypothetical protein